ncbi:hypothetical protein D3C72_2528270 [compost metagenome]
MNISPDRWIDEPAPGEAKVTPCFDSLANFMYSATLCTGRLGLTTRMFGILAIRPIGSKSFSGS